MPRKKKKDRAATAYRAWRDGRGKGVGMPGGGRRNQNTGPGSLGGPGYGRGGGRGGGKGRSD